MSGVQIPACARAREERDTLAASGGFTLLEVAIVVTVLTVLTAVALPIYSGFIERAKVATMQSDLRNLATVQEAHFGNHQGYASNPSSLDDGLQTSENVTVFIDSGTATGWGATAMHSSTASSCRIAYSSSGQPRRRAATSRWSGSWNRRLVLRSAARRLASL
jgi:type IV pilus assembly protein PilE